MKKVAIYCRVSTALQEQEKTVESQLAELREICQKDRVQIIKEYIDEGWSGGTLARPALDQLRDDVSKDIFEAVYIHSPDRLARKYAYQILVLEELKKKGIEVIFFNKPVSDNPEDQLLLGVQGLIAEYEKAKILERTRRGRIHKAKQKGIVGTRPPYGYNYIKRTPDKEEHYEINKKEVEIVNLIFDLYIKFNSLSRVVVELTLRNIKPSRGGEKWSRSTIRQILRNEAYIGTGYYGKYYGVESENGKKYKRRVKNSSRLRNKKEWIPIKYPIVLEKDKFKLAQELLSKNYKPYIHSKHFYLLSGLVRCKYCVSTFTGEAKGKTRTFCYYRCNNRHKRHPLPKTCDAPVVKTKDLDIAVWNIVSKATMTPQILINHISHLANKIGESKTILNNKKEELVRTKTKLLQKKDRLLEIYTEGTVDKEQFLEKMNVYNREEDKIKEEIEEIELKLTQIVDKPLIIKHIRTFCTLAKRKLRALTQEQKKEFLRYLIDEITLDSKKREAKIIGYIPTEIEGLANINPVQSGTLLTSSKV